MTYSGGGGSPPTATAARHARRTVLIIADVDGTLIDGDGCMPITPTGLRERLKQVAETQDAECRLAFASSRTLSELLVLQRSLGVVGPCIAEDGAILALDAGLFETLPQDVRASEFRAGRRNLSVLNVGDRAEHLRSDLGSRLLKYELDVTDTARMFGLGFRTTGAIRRALRDRRASLLLDLRDITDQERATLIEAARLKGADVHRGGRWHTVTRNAGKGKAMKMLRRLTGFSRGAEAVIVAIGNEENDESLLAAADVAYAIHNPGRGVHPSLAAVANVVSLEREGTLGFVEMLDGLSRSPLFDESST